MRLTPLILATATALALSGCVAATVPGTSPTQGSPAGISSLEQQLNNRSIRSDVFAGQLLAEGFIEGSHDTYGRGGTWYVQGSTLCLNFGFNFLSCGNAEFANGVLLHYTEQAGPPIGYDYQ